MLLRTVVFCVCLCVCFGEKGKRGKFVIDNDAGADDAMAIFIALLYENHFDGPELVALTTGNGNTKEDNVYVNNQKILRVAGRQDVPIYRGSKNSLVITPKVTNYYGIDGLGDNDLVYSDLVPAKEDSAVTALHKLSKTHEGNLTVITIGALTNIALAIKTDPDFLNRLDHLYVGAGHIHGEDNPSPEFNALTDAEAYRIVTENANPDKVTIVPFSQVRKDFNFTKDWREEVLGGINTDLIRALNKFERVSLMKEERWQALDPAVISLFLKPEFVEEYKYAKSDIITCGKDRGITTHELCTKNDANVRIIYSVKPEPYKQFLLDLFSPR